MDAAPQAAASADLQSLQSLVKAKTDALAAAQLELEELTGAARKGAEAEIKSAKLERANKELWTANRELERDRNRLTAELERLEAQAALPENIQELDFDRRTTKVLHLARWGQAAQQELPAAASAGSKDSLAAQHGRAAAGGDLQLLQASRQLERFKRATKKYVQDFREGIYGLLGWKVEMRGEGSSMRWHLTSRYQEGHELVFQLRPANDGATAEFDLLSSKWGIQLQADRQAMSYLEIYGSIPGFLAHVTSELLTQKTIH